jgi:lipid-A-disaccharide synthase
MVVLPFSLAPQIPIEGLIEWVTRIPRLGPPLRLWIAREYVRRRPYVALPNMRVGRQIMPELIGAVTPEQVADESARLIRDERARLALARALEAIPLEAGASRRILDAMRPAWTTA